MGDTKKLNINRAAALKLPMLFLQAWVSGTVSQQILWENICIAQVLGACVQKRELGK